VFGKPQVQISIQRSAVLREVFIVSPVLQTNVGIVSLNRQLSLSSLLFPVPYSQSVSSFKNMLLTKPRILTVECQYESDFFFDSFQLPNTVYDRVAIEATSHR
jgi:hypothetical protein